MIFHKRVGTSVLLNVAAGYEAHARNFTAQIHCDNPGVVTINHLHIPSIVLFF